MPSQRVPVEPAAVDGPARPVPAAISRGGLWRTFGAADGLDFLDLDAIDTSEYLDNMFWSYGTKILAAAAFVRDKPNLHIVYITNFKCGPDSYIKHYITEVSGRPFLTLQFDGHNNDAGMLTRCEAYLDSKGVLRRWGSRQQQSEPAAASSR